MFYQEAIFNDKTMYRTVPDGTWYEVSNESMTKKIIELEKRLLDSHWEIIILKSQK